MQIFNWSDLINSNFNHFEEGSALTIGSFDGPHKGHESLFVSVLNAATEKHFIPGIVTFKQALPGLKHPENYAGDIATLEQRLSEYEKRGFKFAVVIDFNEQFASTEGSVFFNILIEKLNLKFLAEGVDFRCGHKGLFDMAKIMEFALQNGFEACFLNLVKTEGERVSSSSIRKMIQKGQFDAVNELLERRFTLINNEELIMNNCMAGDDDSDGGVVLPRKCFSQVMPDSGKFEALINGDVNGAAEFTDDAVKVTFAENCKFSSIKTITF